ncbi:AQG_2a_G0057130.mRNA.1.CDS.1 [Saccharomyces cerevisiae]|uniref:Copper transport protein CTR1 n=3 Tax=Saccharomyces cerevisiae TaxID=4932 RepID=CTR1_YEAST|nr:high-affinity Cu transporter CTR1 [Saccharomyces cerevisiae S288C]P49573.1 RecName: Full=Copper transport protein CTR1; Short=Copper transporter 1 [Saccharomyces cerevisiae S288C]AAA17369.1 copper transport protein [Saccharomyces cerevisiae]AJV94061.1 Ctr1p [Saccharomyces cerevisiae YJM1549]AJV95638.1 Ctr1p [Saccharomyces cerevisiae YJM1615]AJV98953.1 Ctr1p [Saccharomyces cerevisiae YJM320]AJV99393.1 Ctr1p [Saccharomyces cerevisiae YJM326]AJW01998.1 Ctr1p [Saccharomyces cerevisiae YJM1385|eukprot:NP_015449.1 high-affinity Cu transporter CTR1 [Saccharomyces cerevisiae S288C]
MEGMNMGSSMNMDAMSSASKTVASSMASMSMDAMSSASKTILSSMSSMSMEAMSSASKTLASTMSSMASMSMGSSSMSGMSMSMSSTPTSSASAQTTSDSSMSGMSGMSSSDNSSSSGMDMDMSMGMNYYLTPTYKNYPVLFHHLHANNSGKAFGIFLLFVVAAFVYKLLLFVSWCLEVHWFKKWDKQNKYSTLPSANSKDEGKHYDTENNFEIQGLPKLPNLLSDIFVPSLMDLFHDIIRAFLVFTSTMIIYMLMLATMSFVLTYVFAVITGLALSEVFFNRCKIAMLKRWDIQREIQKAKSCPGFGNCQCGRHPEPSPDPIAVADTTSGSDQSTRLEKNNESKVAISENNQKKTPTQEEGCNCATDSGKNQANIERDILENSKLQEQSGNMDQNLLPAEKFTHN